MSEITVEMLRNPASWVGIVEENIPGTGRRALDLALGSTAFDNYVDYLNGFYLPSDLSAETEPSLRADDPEITLDSVLVVTQGTIAIKDGKFGSFASATEEDCCIETLLLTPTRLLPADNLVWIGSREAMMKSLKHKEFNGRIHRSLFSEGENTRLGRRFWTARGSGELILAKRVLTGYHVPDDAGE